MEKQHEINTLLKYTRILVTRLNLLVMMMTVKGSGSMACWTYSVEWTVGCWKIYILNHYRPELNLETNDISKSLNRGKHTTRHVELFERQNGYIADTPGFSALDFEHIDKDDVKYYFLELNRYGEKCKFRNCNHIKEPNCNVKKQLEQGNIAQFRYDHYLQLFNEISNRKVRY